MVYASEKSEAGISNNSPEAKHENEQRTAETSVENQRLQPKGPGLEARGLDVRAKRTEETTPSPTHDKVADAPRPAVATGELIDLVHPTIREWANGHEYIPAGNSFKTNCPAHEDDSPSLNVSLGDNGNNVVLYCHGGCQTDDVLEAFDLDYHDLYLDQHHRQVGGRPREKHELTPQEIHLRDVVYRVLLTHLQLDKVHRDHLRGRGLSDEEINRNEYRTFDRNIAERLAVKMHRLPELADTLFNAPGFIFNNETRKASVHALDGILIPVRNAAGQVLGLKVRNWGGRAKYLWFSTQKASVGTPPHVPLGFPTICPVLRVTEGPLKADVAFHLDPDHIPTIGLAGVSSWKNALPLLAAMREDRGLVAVRLAFDKDALSKPQVGNHLFDFYEAVAGLGLRVGVERWTDALHTPEGEITIPYYANSPNGIDDLFLMGKKPMVEWGDGEVEGLPDNKLKTFEETFGSLFPENQVQSNVVAAVPTQPAEPPASSPAHPEVVTNAGTLAALLTARTVSNLQAAAMAVRKVKDVSPFPKPMKLHEFANLKGTNGVEWVLKDLLPKGGIVLLSAEPKAGKTTLLAHALAAMSQGDKLFLDRALDARPTLLVTEEDSTLWYERVNTYGLDAEAIHVQGGADGLPRPFATYPKQADWDKLCAHLAQQVREQNYALVVVDTLFNLWPVENENDAGEVKKAMAPLKQIAEAGACVLLIVHGRKAGGMNGQGVRGSNALTGAVDIILELKHAGPQHPRRRILDVRGRYGMPTTLTIELGGAGYKLVEEETMDEKAAAPKNAGQNLTLTLLPTTPGLTPLELKNKWPADKKPPHLDTLKAHLIGAFREGKIGRSGGGGKGDPHRYHQLSA